MQIRSFTPSALLLVAMPLLASTAPVPGCQLRVLKPVQDDLGKQWTAATITEVDIERNDSGGGSFCSKGGSCIPRKVSGQDAVVLLNCKIGPSIGSGDFRLVPDAHLVGGAVAATMRLRDSTERRLSHLGFSNASAGTLAQTYVDQPHSAEARLVARALAGSHEAVAVLKRSNP